MLSIGYTRVHAHGYHEDYPRGQIAHNPWDKRVKTCGDEEDKKQKRPYLFCFLTRDLMIVEMFAKSCEVLLCLFVVLRESGDFFAGVHSGCVVS